MASTIGKNRSILAALVEPDPAPDRAVTNPPKESALAAGRLSDRISTLARVTSGEVKEKTLRLIDPERCRLWARHNRRYDLLSPDECADLLESLRAQGEQEFPAIVRRLTDDPNYDYEVICGARRHWSVSYLRRIEHRDIRFLIEERELSDEAAFRLSDLENRSRADICDYERAIDYLTAVQAYYGGVASRMAERLEVSKAWLSRFLDLARLPRPVVQAFGDIRRLRANHARELKPLLEADGSRDRVLAEAERLAQAQAAAREAGEAPMDAAKVVLALRRAADKTGTAAAARRQGPVTVTNAGAVPLFTMTRRGRSLLLEVALAADAPDEDFIIAFRREFEQARARG